ncbi:hypothetical protein [Streptomyces sp. NRRL S-1521]|uniref:hypothetical protein n=1 Tax=Streptomyces sp. NRRL S-1521 TaxID=1609100 RepID=UPI000749A047|nr:hypothetical protein [Streptomyces sp. NRRL S-1521]KUL58621.1 hypothetical protein ADL30_10690 [Streptomyces sp. NRRL S-1521]
MAAESFSAAPETPGTGEPLVSAPAHRGAAQLGAPPPPPAGPAPWPQTADAGRAGAPPDHAPYRTPDIDIGVTRETAVPAPPAGTPSAPPVEAAPDADGEAVEELIRCAVLARPLDDVADLVTRLEQTPEGGRTASSVLRLAAVARSVDDVSRLVELLGPPGHPADRMDEAIRHAAEERPIPEVTRLVQLLSAPPHDPHSSAEAVHAAATSRSVEDLMQLIGSLREAAPAPAPAPAARPSMDAAPPAPVSAPAEPARPAPGMAVGSLAPQKRRNGTTPLVWMRRAAGVLMLLCAVAHLPMDWSRGPTPGLPLAVGVAALCAAAGVVLCLSRSLYAAVTATLLAGALAVGHLVEDRLVSGDLAQMLRPAGVAAPLPTLSAVIAALAALVIVALTVAGLRMSAADRYQAPRV